MKFKYLGETYETTFFNPKLPRRTLSAAINLSPSKDSKRYTLYIYSTNDTFSTAYSSSKYYMNKFNNITVNKKVKNLSRPQCEFLTKVILEQPNFRDAISITKELLETFIEIS